MIRTRLSLLSAGLLVLLVACKPGAGSRVYDAYGEPVSNHVVDFTVLHMNDVYEIAPVEGGRRGGLARVATVIRDLKKENPRFFSVLPGDFLSPSAMGATKINGTQVAGEQMIATMNALGLDYATFGNHEFDIAEPLLRARLSESKSEWIASNVTDAQGQLFPPSVKRKIITYKNEQGDEVLVGLFSICVDMAKKPFVKYLPYVETAKAEVEALKSEGADVIIALTHLSLADDKKLASEVPEIDVVLGGHEHENVAVQAGDDNTPIYKADANARTVYVHRFRYDASESRLKHQSSLTEINQTIEAEPETDKVVQFWTKKVFDAIRANGIEPTAVIGRATEMLDGQESSVRNKPTNLSKLIGEAFLAEAPEADAVIYGSGSIRIDDKIPPGDITNFDVVRIFPFGGKLILVEIGGESLRKALDQGELNKGSGGYLATTNVARNGQGGWLIKGEPLNEQRTYKVLFNDFLLTGLEKGLPFLNLELEANGITKIRDTRDVQTVFIAKLKRDMQSGH